MKNQLRKFFRRIKWKFKIIYFFLFPFLLTGCKSLQTNISIPEKKTPEYIGTVAGDSKELLNINWKEYFGDSLLCDLIDTALKRNLDLQIAMQRVDMVRLESVFAKRELFPKLSLGGVAGMTKYAKYTEEFMGNSSTEYENGKIIPNPLDNYSLGFTSSWEIDIWGKLRNQRKAAVYRYLASLEGRNLIITNLIAEVAILYYELLALDNELDIIRQTLLKQEEALEVVKLQKEAGRSNELVVQQFYAQVLKVRSYEKETVYRIFENENKINVLLGKFTNQIIRSKESLFVNRKLIDGIPVSFLLNRPDIREAEYQVQANKFNLAAAKAAFLPNLNISAVLGLKAFNPQFVFQLPTSIGFSTFAELATPIINRNGLKLYFNTARSSTLTALYNYQKNILNGYMEVANEIAHIKNLQEITVLKEEESKVLTNSIDISEELYKSGRANYLEMLLVQQNALQTKLEQISANKQKQISTINIYKALGGGW